MTATPVTLSPNPKLQFFADSGYFLVGGQLFTYLAGTTSLAETFTDSTGATPNDNPIILNARGECDCWLTPGLGYKFVLSPNTDTNPPTNPIWTVDNIFAPST